MDPLLDWTADNPVHSGAAVCFAHRATEVHTLEKFLFWM